MKKAILLFALSIAIASCSQAQQRQQPQTQQQTQQQESRTFHLPEIPAILTDPTERAAYLTEHYWDHFNFEDTALISMPEVTEQAFVDFINLLSYTQRLDVAVDTLFHRASAEKEMLRHFISLGDKYLYEPNSPMCNEDLYILVLRSTINLPALAEVEKLRPRRRLELALKNRPGDVAADFTVTCRDGRRKRLSGIEAPYLLIYFNDPECEDCQRVKSLLTSSPAINSLQEAGHLKILSVCVEGKTQAWKDATLPTLWIDGYDEGQRLTTNQTYDLKAMPTLYLLDTHKRVLLKDASVQQIEERLGK